MVIQNEFTVYGLQFTVGSEFGLENFIFSRKEAQKTRKGFIFVPPVPFWG